VDANFIKAMAEQDLIGVEDAAALIAEREEAMGKPVIAPEVIRRREDETLARVRRAGREEALWDVVSLLNRAVSECRSRGQETAYLEEVRAEVRKMAAK